MSTADLVTWETYEAVVRERDEARVRVAAMEEALGRIEDELASVVEVETTWAEQRQAVTDALDHAEAALAQPAAESPDEPSARATLAGLTEEEAQAVVRVALEADAFLRHQGMKPGSRAARAAIEKLRGGGGWVSAV